MALVIKTGHSIEVYNMRYTRQKNKAKAQSNMCWTPL